MRLRTLASFLCALLVAWPLAAQEQRGTIEGVVKDNSGSVLPGVSIEARSTSGAVLSTVSDGAGRFRFPSVQPGTYDVSASLSGFKPTKVPNVEVTLGQVRSVEFALGVAGVAETVNVTAESPVVDTKQSARSVNIRAEQIELLPHGRDFTSLVTQAPGVNSEAKLGGISIDGASAAENRFIVNGMETTNLRSGLSGQSVNTDTIEQVEVKSSGYTPEYGGAMGGVINAITKSGTNAFHGYGLMYWQGSKLAKGAGAPGLGAGTNTGRPSLRLNLTDSTLAEYVTYPQDAWNRYEPGLALGGPIVKDKAWFFGAYQPSLTSQDRTVTLRQTGSPITVTQKENYQYLVASQTAQISDGLRSRVSYNNSWSRVEGLLPTLDGSDPVGVPYGKTSTYPNWTLGANVDWVASPHLFFGIRGGYFNSDQHDINVPVAPRFIFSNSTNIGLPGVPVELQRSSGFASLPLGGNTVVDRDQQTRAHFQADSTLYGNLGGEHQVKFGVQIDRLGNNVLSGEDAARVTIRWNQGLSSGRPVRRGPFGYYSVRSNAVNPRQGFITEGDVHTNNIGLFIQDAWTVATRLTINGGVRTERERVPAYTNAPGVPQAPIAFGFKDKLGPRVGFALDVTGDGRTKAFGSWGMFYDIFKLELPRGSFGGEKWLEYYYTLDVPNWPTLVDNPSCPPACSGTLIRGPINFRTPSTVPGEDIEPNLKPMRSQEATFGVDHEFGSAMAASIHYVHKQLDRAVEDTGSLDADGNEIYIIANPGEGLTKLAYNGVPMPAVKRKYDSIEFALEKRLSNNYFFRGSYIWSRLYGNYTGLSQSDENGRVSPNVGRAYDYPLMMFTQSGQGSYGLLPTDRPNQFKGQFIYVFPFGTSIGFNEFVASGLPVTREMAVLPTSNYPVQYLGRLSDGRTDMYSQSDLYVQHELKLAGARRVQVSLQVQNLFNQGAGISKFSTYQKNDGITFDQAAFYAGRLNFDQLAQAQGVAKDPRFLQFNGYQAALQARFGVKFLF
jgi:outer membrane receptor protein involved in Fe transport